MRTILLIEDNDDIRENTCELLELEGYKVISALNGERGMLLAAQRLPDLILCDIMMPGPDGYEVFNGLHANPLTANIPFIFLTASAETKEVAAGLKMGACGYIRKPFGPEELFEAINLCFDGPAV
ncbi:response regulator [Mucilaginibacter rubeus]|uniref:Response regulator n=1 Tax=Mucilaginibacter rubeus TaxID=2027860 RepID=A0AAE6MGV5_9SPHI|nr:MULTISPECIES: response regulator [Mucilaginibacter]QEM02572.1 response regulator [Mucilaginibacter rubeus]QEM15192.1 response regulator [Mucilaginibacter gossypii]QTE42084.1 response regulator [Mucilaginibacter rubeus]QTE48685.1 response regulator [Mucilaginibacter rubeus]QTE60071.1 response regulator [Mucilaginibacter rubeus]